MVVGQTGEYVDILVLGGGPGGYSAAIRAAQLGRSVALVERDRVGGVCLNEGCIPSKALLNASRLFRALQDATAMGIDASPRLDFERMCRWKEGLVQRLSAGVTELLQRYDVRVKSGTAHFASNHRVSVDRVTDFEFVDFGTAIIATGSRALGLENFETDGTQIISPESALAVDTLPGRLGIVGGGYVALELATAFGRLGTKVTVVVPEERILPEVDAVLAQVVSRSLRGLGVELILDAQPRSLSSGVLVTERRDGSILRAEVDALIAASSRSPNTAALGLGRMGVATDSEGRIVIDAQCRTSVAAIFAVGDVVAGPLVAARAIAQGRVAAEAAAGLPSAYEPAATPLAYFTEPEVMSAGLTEAAAIAAGLLVHAERFPFAASGRAVTLGERQGFMQIVAEATTGRVVGIHAAGPGVTELAGEATLALEMGATIDDLALTIHPHPTLSESIPEAAWLALGTPLHVFRAGGRKQVDAAGTPWAGSRRPLLS